MKRVLSLILIFVTVFAVAACSSKKKKDVIKEQVTKEVSSEEGGTVSTSDESVSIEIPGDALDSNTQITVTVYESSHHATAEGEQIMSQIVEFEPSGTIFKKPIIITMRSTENIKNKVVSAAVYNEAKGEWSYSKHGAYAVIVGKDEAGDPIMQSAAGDPIMLNAAGDPIMMNAAGDPIMMSAAGDPIMLAAAGDPIMTNAAGDPIMNAAAGDPIMMTTGHFTAYAFITSKSDDETADNDDADADDDDDADNDADADEPVYVPECGNGIVDEGEECDNGAGSHELRGPEAACRKDCTLVRCGDSILDEGEECDDGNTKDGDYCSADCKTVTGSCGDGTKQDNEECDDGNTKDGDYCSPDCQTVTGSCGDGKKQSNEACDKADPEYGEGEGIGASCSDDCQIVTLSCGTLPENAEWVSGDTYGSTWNGEEYSSASPHYAESGDCAYKCKATYTWTGSVCACTDTQHVEDGVCTSNTKPAASCGTLPANAQWVSGETYVPTWNGSAYSSAAANYAESGNCAYKCKATYTWTGSVCACTDTQHVEDGVCTLNTKAAASCGTLPANAQWVGDDTYIPTWNGSAYSSAAANYAESGECAFMCKATYVWVETDGTCACPSEQHVEGGICKLNTGEEQECTNLPDNAAWKKSTYIPHWIDEAWSTEPAATYYGDEAEECTFDCVENFHYEDASCQSDTKPAESCGELPANAQWVGGNTYIPTWYGEGYSSATAHYAAEGECAYKCKETYTWIDSSCTCTDIQHVEDGICKSNTGEEQECTNLPDNAAWKKSTYIPHWIDEAWSTEPAATYYADGGEECTFDCVENFHYEDASCLSDTKEPASCGELPENTEWVKGSTYIPTWNGEDYSSATAHYAAEGDCAYKCKATYTWVETNGTCACPAEQHVEEGVCKSNTGEEQGCTNLPDNAEWVAATYTPHWIDEAWSTEPAATYYADGGEECTFDCVENFHYEDASCQSDTKPAESCGELPENTEWVKGSTYIPTWNGEDYSSATAHYAAEGDCAYKCKATYTWVETNGTCACPEEQHVEDGVCKSNTGEEQNCTNLPDNAEWVAATYTPHWIDEAWSTEPAATYYADEAEECSFECDTDYHYEDGSCKFDMLAAESCGDLPENAVWVEGDGTYIPTWDGEEYSPATANYAEEGDCAFLCSGDYEWNESTMQCRAPLAKVLCTGQTKCFSPEGYVIDCPAEGEEFYGQDANYTARQSCTPQAYQQIENIDGNVIVDDLSTGLRWYLYSNGGTWENAYTFCDTLDTGDGREWRLPTAKELMSIIDNGTSYPALRLAYFGNEFSSYNSYWSGTYYLNAKTGQDEVLVMDVGYGHLQYDAYGKEGSNYFACVSGEEYGVAGTFTEKNISGGTVVTDSATDLMWKVADDLNMTWDQAIAYCENLEYAGFYDWRLPNRNEFATILNYDKGFADNKSDFPGIIGGNYWTSTFAQTYGGSARAFIMEVGGGTMFGSGDTNGGGEGIRTAYTLCVRNDDLAEYQAVPVCNETGYTPCEDPETKIIWSQNINTDRYDPDYVMAARMCRESNNGGISQWRLPTIDEIRTILKSDALTTGGDCGVTNTCNGENCYNEEKCETGLTMESIFYNDSFIVSSTTLYDDENHAWGVDFFTGSIVSYARNDDLYPMITVRCVKDDSIPNVEFPYTDNENSLVWSELSADQLSWDEANEYCTEDEEYAWRLPTIEELETLVQGCHDGGCAPDVSGGYSALNDVSILWSSTVTRNQMPTYVETYYNVLDFMTASQTELTSDAIRNFYAKVRCVADVDENPSPCDLYPCLDIENSDGTCSETLDGGYICGCDEGYEWDGEECWATEPDFPECSPESEFPCIDSEYELVWSAKSSSEMNWENAGSYCENLTEGGYDDWRLPTIDELRTIVQNCPGSQSGGACAISDPDHLSNSDFSDDCYCDSMGNNNGYYSRLGDDDLVSLWSSSTTSGNTDRAWRVGFDDAYVYGYNKSGNNYVRCVR